uniref:hypothetical protein n=1 Tax=Alistipes sp. TaxID=1872444 RepID=UPI004055CE33
MRKIFKLMMSVVAMAAVVSCTTDATEDLSVKVGGKTQLTLSLDNSRTQLGEKAGDAYPLTWAAGDQISVNGVASDPLGTEDGAGTANATFTFDGALTTPYFVAYPATAEGQVLFAAEQNHTSNTTFGNNAAVMYGYSANGESIKMQHLTGILKIGIEGTSPTKVTTVRISTIDRKPIAGAFEVKYDTEKQDVTLTPVENATSSVITYNFLDEYGDNGIDLSMQDGTTFVHIAVPAGEYNELYVTIEDEMGGVMYKTVKADNTLPLNAGKVREFTTTITYAPIDSANTFVISDFASLITLKETLEEAQKLVDDTTVDDADEQKVAAVATLSRNAVVVNDIEIDPAQVKDAGGWNPIEATSYTGTINGNGYEIKGLPGPLFNNTAASFKGLHMNTSIEETENPLFGVLARKVIATTNAPVVENCTVSGTITIDCKEYVPTTSNSFSNASSGAFIGYAYGVAFKDCTNYANFDIKKFVSESDTGSRYGAAAGFVAYANTANGLFVSFDNCHNKGNITYAEGAQSVVRVNFGGLVGAYYGAGAVATFNNCSNSGNITINANTRGGYIGGIMGYIKGDESSPKTLTFTNNTTNTGIIKVEGTCDGDTMVGGIVGNSNPYNNFIFEGPVKNDAPITINGNVTGCTFVGGLFGECISECKVTFKNSVENTAKGVISVNGNSTNRTAVGGIIGYANTNTKNTSNGVFIEGATVTNNAAVSINGSSYGEQVFLAGVVGSSENTAYKFSKGGKLVNNGKLTMSDTVDAAKVVRIGGVAGYNHNDGPSLVDENTDTGYIVNTGDIEFKGLANAHLDIGGIWGRLSTSLALTSVINTGNIKAYGAFTEKYSTGSSKNNVRVGGIVAYGYDKAMKNIQCYCNIEAYTITKSGDSYTFTSFPLVGMFSGNPATFTAVENVQIGGKIATTATVVDGVVTPTWSELTSTNYYDYVFGLRTNLTEFTGVSHLAAKPNVK